LKPLNLASRPARNEALPNALFVAGVVLAAALSVQHALHLNRLLGSSSSTLHAEVASLQDELTRLRGAAQGARVAVPEPAKLAEWRAVKELVDRRVFSWSVLLSRLSALLPPGVRLLSVQPSVSAASVRIELDAIARTRDDGFELVRALRESGAFENVFPLSVNTTARGEEFSYTMEYRPAKAPEKSS
jgi:Tfp pilus assembly protein PilN